VARKVTTAAVSPTRASSLMGTPALLGATSAAVTECGEGTVLVTSTPRISGS